MHKEIGFIGLGRMGLNMSKRLVEAGYRVVGYNRSEEPRGEATRAGIEIASTLSETVSALSSPRTVWIMVTNSAVDAVLAELVPLLAPGDTVIDGGNSFYKDSVRRHAELKEKDILFLDCGTSGGLHGARNGASLMVGGPVRVFEMHEHLFKALAAEDGYARVGNEGAGHFVKMIHNSIEYGMMGAIAEGIAVLHEHEAEFGIDLREVFKPYEHESVITSKLVTWLREAYEAGQIDVIKGEVPLGETEVEMERVTTLGKVEVLEAALAQRKETRTQESYRGRLIAAMRNQFGGHKVITKE
jgi:6-phosphogluconate dehydrogenase